MMKEPIPEELRSAVGKLIRQGRTARSLSHAAAAERIGVSVDALVAYENGAAAITADHLMFIMAKYGGVRTDAAEELLIGMLFEQFRFKELADS